MPEALQLPVGIILLLHRSVRVLGWVGVVLFHQFIFNVAMQIEGAGRSQTMETGS